MQESSFRFMPPALASVNYNVNPDYRPEKGKTWPVGLLLEVSVNKSEERPEAMVELITRINYSDKKTRDKDAPFWMTAAYISKFTWDDSITGEQLDKLLEVNAPAVLLSYVRPLVAQITGLSPFQTYHIPFLNLADMPSEVWETSSEE